MLQHKVLISKGPAIDGLAPSPVAPGEVATLTHELRDDPMERGAFEVQRLAGTACSTFPSAQASKVFYCLGCHICPQLDDYASCRLPMYFHIKVHAREVCHGETASAAKLLLL
jgi:hypothetical protein